MMMETKIKTLVSKKKLRLVEGRYNLDLTYILPRIIAMGYPADNVEAIYRNDAQDVLDFLTERHGEHFHLFNLCCERSYNPARFGYRVDQFGMQDHMPPPMEMIPKFCQRVDEVLTADKNNVVAIHCKAGKGRTGAMICCYLLHADLEEDPEQALAFYGSRRTSDGRGVTIPSQRRYVHYYHRLLQQQRLGRRYEPVPLRFLQLILRPRRTWEGAVQLQVFSRSNPDGSERPLAETAPVRVKRCDCEVSLTLDGGVVVSGDVRLELTLLPRLRPRERICQVWCNTWFLADAARGGRTASIVWQKEELDQACNDRRVPDDAEVELVFRRDQPRPAQIGLVKVLPDGAILRTKLKKTGV